MEKELKNLFLFLKKRQLSFPQEKEQIFQILFHEYSNIFSTSTLLPLLKQPKRSDSLNGMLQDCHMALAQMAEAVNNVDQAVFHYQQAGSFAALYKCGQVYLSQCSQNEYAMLASHVIRSKKSKLNLQHLYLAPAMKCYIACTEKVEQEQDKDKATKDLRLFEEQVMKARERISISVGSPKVVKSAEEDEDAPPTTPLSSPLLKFSARKVKKFIHAMIFS